MLQQLSPADLWVTMECARKLGMNDLEMGGTAVLERRALSDVADRGALLLTPAGVAVVTLARLPYNYHLAKRVAGTRATTQP